MPPYESDLPGERCDDLRCWMSQRRRWTVGVAVNEPRNRSVTRDEALIFGCRQLNPRQTREMPNLEVPSLHM